MTTPVIFDTDAGTDIDDLYALALIVAHPELELLGVTTTTGDTQARARLAAKMLRLQGAPDVPVYAGARLPLAPTDTPGAPMGHHTLTHCDLVSKGDPEHGREYGDGIEFILETLRAATQPITLIGTGPWTNLAEVLSRADEKLKSKIKCIALMGGEVHTLLAEWNVKGDPEAADVVLKSGVPVFMGTWSVTRQLRFDMDEVGALIGESPSPFLQALYSGTQMWWNTGITDKRGPVLYDAVPVFWAAGERNQISCIRIEELPVELDGQHTRGMTVPKPHEVANAPKTAETGAGYIAVSNEMDAATLKSRFVELVVPNDSL